MSQLFRKTVTITVFSLVLILALGAPAAAGSRIERELTLAPGGEFLLDTDVGTVEIVGTSSAKVRVVVTSRTDDIESRFDFSFNEKPGRVEVRVEKKGSKLRWFSWGDSRGLRFQIEVPHDTDIDIDTSGGSIMAEEIEGTARLDTSGGSIEAREIGDDLLADTSGGSIVIENVNGNVNADTSGGSITVEAVRGDVRADTSGGSINVSDVTGDINADTSGGSIRISKAEGHVLADTSGGSVTVSFAPGNSRGGSLSTSGGGVRVRLDPSVNLDIDASASGGSVIADIPITVQGKFSKSSLRGRIGSGGETLKLRASGGKIRIEPL